MLIFTDPSDRRTKAEKLRLILSDHEWHSTKELVSHIGHTFGGAIYQLRQQGFTIKRQAHSTKKYQHLYRLISTP